MEQAEVALRKYLNKYLDDINYTVRDVHVKPITSGGANYTSGLFKITVTSPGQETLRLFSKVAIVGEQLREKMMFEDLFLHERIVYEELQKAHESLHVKYNIPEKERFQFAKYYGSSLEKGSEVFLFEDLNEKGFLIYDRFDSLNWDHVVENINTLANFHALSFVLEKEMPELFEKIKKFSFPREMIVDMMSGPVETYLEGLSETHRDKLRKFVKDMGGMQAIAEFYLPFGRNVIVHSDYRPSNIMYRENAEGITVLPVDYQTLRVGSAASDLVYYVMTATDGAFRRAHFAPLLDAYHAQLTLRLAAMNVRVDEVYPREQLDKEMRKMLPMSLLFAIAMYPVLLVPPEAAPDVASAEADVDTFRVRPSSLATARLGELVDDFLRWGLL